MLRIPILTLDTLADVFLIQIAAEGYAMLITITMGPSANKRRLESRSDHEVYCAELTEEKDDGLKLCRAS